MPADQLVDVKSILLLEPYFGGSHKQWSLAYQRHSKHQIKIVSLPAQFWKWRMQGGAISFARLFDEGAYSPDVILATDMMDVSLFRAVTRTTIPIALYFHENQLSYPQNHRQHHGWQYGFINYASALASDAIFFNSQYHHDNFFEQLRRMLKHFADFNELQTIDELRDKASVLSLGLDLRRFDAFLETKPPCANKSPVILWNHRWEPDKNPQEFFESLYELDRQDFDFRVIVIGENVRQVPEEFEQARKRLGDRIIHFGYVEQFCDYVQLLQTADYVVSTAYQEFFGVAVSEAIYCGCIPILPKRLNYPHLIPESSHHSCLYPEGKLVQLLRHHLNGKFQIDTTLLKSKIAQYDWAIMAPQYDTVFDKLC